jgi:hypothetical protein
MRRRKLITGSAALATVAMSGRRASAAMTLPPPQVFPPDVAYRRALTSVLCCNNSNTMYSVSKNADSANNSLNSARTCTVPLDTNITDLTLGFPGFGMTLRGGLEVSIPNGFSMTAAIEYPLGSTPRQIFFNGLATGSQVPGRTVVKSDPYPGLLLAGSQFRVKTYITWTGTLWLITGGSSTLLPPGSIAAAGDWTNRGTNLTDQTLTSTIPTQTTSNLGYSPIIYAKPTSKVPVLATVSDSWFAGLNDIREPVSGGTTIIRAMRNKIPIGVSGQGGFAMYEYLQRQEGQRNVLRDACTHLIMELGINDADGGGQTITTLENNWLATVQPFIARGVKVIAWTLSPHTTSTDGFITTSNQMVNASESIRLGFNTWLRANWQSAGASQLIDAARALDPTDSGFWPCDVGSTLQTTTGVPPGPVATLTGGVVTSVSTSSLHWSVGTPVGTGYPASQTFPWTTTPYPGETGSGAAGTMTTNSSGVTSTWTVTNGGSNYSAPPMINLLGAYTFDGLHGYPRAWNQIIAATGLGPAMLTF